MARTYATIDAGIWADEEFCALSAGAQRTYFMLITQTDITACGSLPLTLRRWARTCSDKDLEVWLAELSDARFVLIDEDTEELLVRTFVKWDGGYKHAKRLMAVVGNAKAIRSDTLRKSVLEELAKLGVSDGNTQATDREPVATPEAIESRRSVVKEVGKDCTPHSTLREPPPSEADVEPSQVCSRHPNGTEKACGPCGSARQRWARWQKREERRELEAKRGAEHARTNAVLTELRTAKAAAVPRPKEAS